MAQLEQTKIVEPFGEVNIFNESDGSLRVKATILMKPEVEGAQTGLAIDGSKSMSQLFGGQVAVSSIFGNQSNLVEPVAQTIAEYLANFDSDGETSVIYWACGMFGADFGIMGFVGNRLGHSGCHCQGADHTSTGGAPMLGGMVHQMSVTEAWCGCGYHVNWPAGGSSTGLSSYCDNAAKCCGGGQGQGGSGIVKITFA